MALYKDNIVGQAGVNNNVQAVCFSEDSSIHAH